MLRNFYRYFTEIKIISCLFLSFLFSTFPVWLPAQDMGILKGVVTDASNHETIIGANIYDLNDMTHGASSDVNGNYQLSLSAGSIPLSVHL